MANVFANLYIYGGGAGRQGGSMHTRTHVTTHACMHVCARSRTRIPLAYGVDVDHGHAVAYAGTADPIAFVQRCEIAEPLQTCNSAESLVNRAKYSVCVVQSCRSATVALQRFQALSFGTRLAKTEFVGAPSGGGPRERRLVTYAPRALNGQSLAVAL